METEGAIRKRLVAFRVTEDEHHVLSSYASDGDQTMTGLLRRLVAERVTGFGRSKRAVAIERKDKKQ